MGNLIDEREAARLLNLNINTIRGLRRAGRGPRFYLLGVQKVGYCHADLEEWLAGRANVLPPKAWRTAAARAEMVAT